MLLETDFAADPTADDWADRSACWLQISDIEKPARKPRQRNPTPLILNGHGVSLRIENGALVVRDGFTHYPQSQSKYRFFPRDLDLPTRILLLDGSGTLSFDVLSWLSEQGVALARVKWTGEIATVASGTGYAADRAKVACQEASRADEAHRLTFGIELIAKKIAASIETLERHFGHSPKRERSIRFHRDSLQTLRMGGAKSLADLRGIEGQCARHYFAVWEGVTLTWTGTKPLPSYWQEYRSRGSITNEARPTNQFASHPLNAMLNYAYAVKLAQLQIQAIADGYDPTIGIMHNGRRGKPAYIFDLIEPERPRVDAAVLAMIGERTFAPADFILRKDGVCRLSPQLARTVATKVLQSTA